MDLQPIERPHDETRAGDAVPARVARALATLLVSLLAGCTASDAATRDRAAPAAPVPEAVPAAEESWDRELPASWQFNDFVDDDAEAIEEAAGVATTAGEPRAQPLAVLPIRVEDDVTGEPIAGARIDNWGEADTPHAEPWEDWHAGTWTTDRDGRTVVPARDRHPWYYVDAPGYAPLGEMSLEDVYRLTRGRDFTIEVRDWLGRPAAGAVVDYDLGCGHTPNARCETAGPDGRIVLRCVNGERGDLWIRHPGIAGRNDGYGGWDDLPEDGGVLILRGDPGPVVEGLVLRADGTLAAGARVGTRESHRGPWTVAGPDGRYRLVGARPREDLIAMAPSVDPVPQGFESPQVEFLSVPGVFTTVRLPAEGKRWPTGEESEAARTQRRAEREAFERGEDKEPVVPLDGPGVRVTVTTATSSSGRVGLLLVRDGDGAALRSFPMCREGAATRSIAVPSGTWTVTAGDAAGMLRPASQRVVVTSGWTDVAFTLEPNPVWTPRIVERAADGTETRYDAVDGGRFRVVSEDGDAETTPRREDVQSASGVGHADGSIFIPAEGLFSVEFRADGRCARVFLDGPPKGPGPVLVLSALPPEERSLDESEQPRDFPSARLQVLLPDGRPAAGLRGTLRSALRSGTRYRGRRSEERDVQFDADGAASVRLDRGTVLEAELDGDDSDGVLPLRARIDGPGPWTIRWPTGTVDVRAVDEQGTPLPEFAVGLNGWDTLDPVDGVVQLRGVGAGPLRLWVGAPGRRMHDLRLVLAAGETRVVTVRMRPSAAE